MTVIIGFLAAYGLLQVMNTLIGARIGKGLPALLYCTTAGIILHLVMSI